MTAYLVASQRRAMNAAEPELCHQGEAEDVAVEADRGRDRRDAQMNMVHDGRTR